MTLFNSFGGLALYQLVKCDSGQYLLCWESEGDLEHGRGLFPLVDDIGEVRSISD